MTVLPLIDACPKRMEYGPCGGVGFDGSCEIDAAHRCAFLDRPFGDRAALRGQIEHLLEITQQSNISLQVTPFELTRPSAEGAFTILRFGEPEIPDIVYLEHLCGALYLDKSEEVELYSKASHRLAIDARTPEESRKALHEARQQL